MVDSLVPVVFSQSITANSGAAGLIVSGEVDAQSVRAGILLARQVNGEVEAVLDTPRALLAGIAAGSAAGLVIFLMQLLVRKRSR